MKSHLRLATAGVAALAVLLLGCEVEGTGDDGGTDDAPTNEPADDGGTDEPAEDDA
jgi:hypothetical protein